MAVTIRQVIADALFELVALGIDETPSPAVASFCLGRINQILDAWNADGDAVYSAVFSQYALVPSLNPHTIGPSTATFTVPQRPVSIDNAALVITNARFPLELIDLADYADLTLPDLASTMPTKLYYAPDWPNGSIYLYPVPSVTRTLEIQTRTLLAQVTLDTVVSLPPGYQQALTLTLAEDLANPLAKPANPITVQKASLARARIFRNNRPVPTLVTRDAGLPGGSGGYFDYLTGENR